MKKIKIEVDFGGGQLVFVYPEDMAKGVIQPSIGVMTEAVNAIKSGEKEIVGVIPSGYFIDTKNLNKNQWFVTVITIEEALENLKKEGILP